MVSLIFLQGEKTKSYRTNVREMCSSSTLLKIKGTKELAYFVLFSVMLTSSSLAAPNRGYTNIDAGGQQGILFHNCREVDFEHLQLLMGSSFDSKRMAIDKTSIDHNSFTERSISNALDNEIDDDNSDYLNDMPYSNTDDDDFGDFSDLEHSENGLDAQDDEGSKPDQNSINYMRRKRQTKSNYLNEDNEIDRIRSSRKNSGEKPQKKLFSDLKKFIRKSKKGRKVKKLPWACHLQQQWVKRKDTYPPFLLSGSCQSQKKCFYNLYDCKPVLYGVKILRRDPSRCNPIPALGNSTVYEEVWIKEQVDVTTGCECGIGKNRKSRRRKNKGRP
ncbi:unnamed protein product [Mytilus coruscus]|uniref:Uncharacterized protein n=1 Tax=Mytilus coruscus TaxID=42192 RepID=A0A6J8CU24_MYTCO|nr:unnamed protein product [Mytilus coruscus]